jgi:hypothetical protein
MHTIQPTLAYQPTHHDTGELGTHAHFVHLHASGLTARCRPPHGEAHLALLHRHHAHADLLPHLDVVVDVCHVGVLRGAHHPSLAARLMNRTCHGGWVAYSYFRDVEDARLVSAVGHQRQVFLHVSLSPHGYGPVQRWLISGEYTARGVADTLLREDGIAHPADTSRTNLAG